MSARGRQPADRRGARPADTTALHVNGPAYVERAPEHAQQLAFALQALFRDYLEAQLDSSPGSSFDPRPDDEER